MDIEIIIKNIFSAKRNKRLYELCINKIIDCLNEAKIADFVNSGECVFEIISNIQSVIFSLPLPRVILVEIFFIALPPYEVYLSEEGMVSTGQCQDCENISYPVYNNQELVNVHNLYCERCGGELFLQETYYM